MKFLKNKKSAKKPEISVIIPAFNEERYIEKCILSLRQQTHKNFEIIIVDDGSTDKTREIISSFKEVVLIHGKHQGPGASRNLGAKYAKGKYLVFIDADMTFEGNYLHNLITPMKKDSSLIGTTHDYEIATNTSGIWSTFWGKTRVSRPNDYSRPVSGMVIFRAIRKDKFISLGGFDPKYGYADDQTFWYKYKIQPIVSRNTTCYHRNPETLKEVFSQSRWIGSSYRSFWIDAFIGRHLIPPLLWVLTPFVITALLVKRISNNKPILPIFKLLIYLIVRYFGTVSGIAKRIYMGRNVR